MLLLFNSDGVKNQDNSKNPEPYQTNALSFCTIRRFHFLQYLQEPSMQTCTLNTFGGQYSMPIFGLVTVHKQANNMMRLNGLSVHHKLNWGFSLMNVRFSWKNFPT